MTKETRVYRAEPFDVDGESRTLTGYGAVFESRSQDLGGFVEEIAPNAFNRTLANSSDILVAYNHDVDKVLGRTSSGTASVSVDSHGLRYTVDSLPNTQAGNDTLEQAQRGDLVGSSFTFSVTEGGQEWRTEENGTRVRRITEARLYELGPVINPAYTDTSVALRSLEQVLASEDADEEVDEPRESTPVHTPGLLIGKR